MGVFSRDLTGHEVKTAREMAWTTIESGALLSLATEHFDVFVTVDRKLSFQQNLGTFPNAVIVLHASTNRLADLRSLVPELLTAIQSARPGTATIVHAPPPAR